MEVSSVDVNLGTTVNPIPLIAKAPPYLVKSVLVSDNISFYIKSYRELVMAKNMSEDTCLTEI